MNFETSSQTLASTFSELTHLLIAPARLTLEEAKLGDGGFGEVCLGTLDKSSGSPRKVAVKELRIPLVVRQRIAYRLARELKVWAKAKHPNILELIGYQLSADYGCARLVSAYMANGNVMEYLKKRPVSAAVRLKLVRDIAAGLKYLHDFSPPICHGDLKPANVLVNESIDALLCDFGVSSFIHESGAASGLTTSMSIKGSTRYMSPELLLEEQSAHNLQSDVWAWGCTAFEIMTERIPYSAKTKDSAIILEIYQKSAPGSIDALGNLILSTAVDPACHTGVSSLQLIIPQCWDFDPVRRPSSSSILHDISSPSNREARLAAWEDEEAGISSLRIGDEFDNGGSSSQGSISSLCANCQRRPTAKGREFCSKICLDDAASKLQSVGVVMPNFRTRAANNYDEDYDGNNRGGSGSGRSPSQGAVFPYRASSLCINCQQHPKFEGRDFCSKACLNAITSLLTGSPKNDTLGYGFAGVALPNVANRVQSPPYQAGNSRDFVPIAYQGTGYANQAYQPNWQQQRPPIAPASQVLPRKPCKIMNCNGTESFPGSKYCSDKCLTLSVRTGLEIACLMCEELPKAPESDFCRQVCSDRAEQRAPLLLNIPKNDPKFTESACTSLKQSIPPNFIPLTAVTMSSFKLFDISWRHSSRTKPTVVFVYKIVQSKQLMDSYLAYRKKVESEGNFKVLGKKAGNECRRWHGTKRLCTIGDNPANPTLCAQTGCPMCSILRTSFQVAKTNASGRTFKRHVPKGFGEGFYTSSTSSKAYDSASNGDPASQYSIIMLANVIVGRGCSLTQENPALTAPPAGYHSVLGEVSGSLNYDELVVYNDDAIRPSWLVVYK